MNQPPLKCSVTQLDYSNHVSLPTRNKARTEKDIHIVKKLYRRPICGYRSHNLRLILTYREI